MEKLLFSNRKEKNCWIRLSIQKSQLKRFRKKNLITKIVGRKLLLKLIVIYIKLKAATNVTAFFIYNLFILNVAMIAAHYALGASLRGATGGYGFFTKLLSASLIESEMRPRSLSTAVTFTGTNCPSFKTSVTF